MPVSNTASVREQEVPAGIGEIEAQIERLVKFNSELEERLASVLHPSEVKEGEPEKAPVRVPLAEKLFALARQVEFAGNHIADLVKRLEL